MSFVLLVFASKLLDPFYPFLGTTTPGVLVAITSNLLLVSVFLVLLSFCWIGASGLTLVIELTLSVVLTITGLTFSLAYGSSLGSAERVAAAQKTTVLECKEHSNFCTGFLARLGAENATEEGGDLQEAVAEYVNARSVLMGPAVAAMLLGWLILHSVTMYFVFREADGGRKSARE
jgi:hypothetical protein